MHGRNAAAIMIAGCRGSGSDGTIHGYHFGL